MKLSAVLVLLLLSSFAKAEKVPTLLQYSELKEFLSTQAGEIKVIEVSDFGIDQRVAYIHIPAVGSTVRILHTVTDVVNTFCSPDFTEELDLNKLSFLYSDSNVYPKRPEFGYEDPNSKSRASVSDRCKTALNRVEIP